MEGVTRSAPPITPAASALVRRIQRVRRGDWPALLALGREAARLPRPARDGAYNAYIEVVSDWRPDRGESWHEPRDD